MIVTSFSQKGYHQYGKNFIETFLQNWPDERLLVYYERGIPSSAPQDDRVTYINLYRFDDFVAFENIILASHPLFRGLCYHPKSEQPLYNFRFDVNRFFRKVYALHDAFTHHQNADRFMVWIDGDVSFENPLPDNFLSDMMPTNVAFAHLNREWLYTEAGFMAFNLFHPSMAQFMELYKATYFNGAFRYLGEMHDCYVIDFVSRLLDVPRRNLSVNEHSDHPFQESVLGKYMTHLKGPDRKKAGKLLDTDPQRMTA